MLTENPHLVVRRPSPTTAEFTITTRPSNPTLPVRLLLLVLPPLRLLTGVFALLLLCSSPHWSTLMPSFAVVAAAAASATSSSSPTEDPESQPSLPPLFASSPLSSTVLPLYENARHLFGAISRSPLGHAASSGSAAVPLAAMIPLSLCLLWLSLRRLHSSESLLVLRGLGVQTSSDPRWYLLSSTHTRFIPTEKIRDVLVNEAFRGFEVRYYLVVVVEGEDDIVVVFPGLLPRKRVVETVWRGARRCLFDGEVRAVGMADVLAEEEEKEKKKKKKEKQNQKDNDEGKGKDKDDGVVK